MTMTVTRNTKLAKYCSKYHLLVYNTLECITRKRWSTFICFTMRYGSIMLAGILPMILTIDIYIYRMFMMLINLLRIWIKKKNPSKFSLLTLREGNPTVSDGFPHTGLPIRKAFPTSSCSHHIIIHLYGELCFMSTHYKSDRQRVRNR